MSTRKPGDLPKVIILSAVRGAGQGAGLPPVVTFAAQGLGLGHNASRAGKAPPQ